MKTSLSTLDADIAQFVPYDNLSFAIVAPPILPILELIEPLNAALPCLST